MRNIKSSEFPGYFSGAALGFSYAWVKLPVFGDYNKVHEDLLDNLEYAEKAKYTYYQKIALRYAILNYQYLLDNQVPFKFQSFTRERLNKLMNKFPLA